MERISPERWFLSPARLNMDLWIPGGWSAAISPFSWVATQGREREMLRTTWNMKRTAVSISKGLVGLVWSATAHHLT